MALEKTPYFDYCAVLIIIIMLTAIFVGRLYRGKVNVFFLLLVLVVFADVLFDIGALSVDNAGEGNRVLKYIFHDGYLIFRNMTLVMINMYLMALTDTWHKMKGNRFSQVFALIPFVVVVVSVIASNFTGWVYYLDDNDTYVRGEGFWILYVSVGIYIVYWLHFLISYTQYLDLGKRLALFAILPLIMTAVCVQAIWSNVVIELFATAASLLFIMLIVQKPEQRMDSLTGLMKLSAYEEDIKRCVKHEKQVDIILINPANFRAVHEVIGYDSTNVIIKRLADWIIAFNRQCKLGAELYHIGNGRFRVVVDRDRLDKVSKAALLINKKFNSNIEINGMNMSLQAYVSIAAIPEDIADFDSLIAYGNSLEREKLTGNIIYARDILGSKSYNFIKEMDAVIEKALQNNKFEVHYQPIYSVKEKRFNSAEALCRLIDDKYGYIPPDIFIGAAEKSGAIHRLGAYVLEEVCRFIASDEFKDLGIDYIEVNVSVVQCMKETLAAEIIDTLDQFGVRPEQINLEITETAMSYSQNSLYNNIKQLTDAGIEFSLDDFGTGYSNMKRIAALPFAMVKLDKSFTDVEESEKLPIIIRNTIKMFKDMKLKIVVEGVENKELVDMFSGYDCEYIQGYYYSMPISKDGFVSFIKQSK